MKREKRTCCFPSLRIAPGGFEPPFSDPKSDVLPLDEGAPTTKNNLLDHVNRNNVNRGPRLDDSRVVQVGREQPAHALLEDTEDRRDADLDSRCSDSRDRV